MSKFKLTSQDDQLLRKLEQYNDLSYFSAVELRDNKFDLEYLTDQIEPYQHFDSLGDGYSCNGF